MGGLEALDRFAPQWLKDAAPKALKDRLIARTYRPQETLPSYPRLQRLMERYTVEHLQGITPAEFERTIRGFLDLEDGEIEGYADASKQRDLSVRFHWGHNHDFGAFALPGLMQDRHIALLATFIDRFDALPPDLTGMHVLDVGCWTGGTSLLLAAMGARVVAVDEVGKYVECVRYLAEAFGVETLDARHASLYECTGQGFDDAFDVVLFAGVLYHLTDPVLALRITFDALADGGVCLVETAAVRSKRAVVAYDGPARHEGASGWNWFRPSAPALASMMRDVGFEEGLARDAVGSRAFAVARRTRHTDMLRAGLSARHVR